MSKKIIANLFDYAAESKSKNLIITRHDNHISFDYYLPGGERKKLSLPKKLETNFFTNLKQILEIASDELVSQKYYKFADRRQNLNFYLTILPEANGEKIIFDFINNSSKKDWPLNQLGLQRDDLQEIEKCLKSRSGLIVVSTPPGEGKSSILQAIMQKLNHPSINIYSLEKKPSNKLPGINSLKLSPNNWEKVLQHDSDLIFADDADEEIYLKNALRAAATGRLVIISLTASDPLEVIDRLLKIESTQRLKIANLKMIINGRLAKLKRPASKKSKDQREVIGLFEIFKLTPNLKKFITGSLTNQSSDFYQKLLISALKDGHRPLEVDRQLKTKNGLL